MEALNKQKTINVCNLIIKFLCVTRKRTFVSKGTLVTLTSERTIKNYIVNPYFSLGKITDVQITRKARKEFQRTGW